MSLSTAKKELVPRIEKQFCKEEEEVTIFKELEHRGLNNNSW